MQKLAGAGRSSNTGTAENNWIFLVKNIEKMARTPSKEVDMGFRV